MPGIFVLVPLTAAAASGLLGGVEQRSWWVLACGGMVTTTTNLLVLRTGERWRQIGLRGGGAAPVVPRQTPPDLADFVGRRTELARLLAPPPTRGAGDVRIVYGPAGIGKTALATRAVTRLARDYPDGQLYVDLQGHGPTPPAPAEVLNGWLRDLGVPAAEIPLSLGERQSTLRSRLAGRRMILFLDDAGRQEQVTPLLAGGGSACLVMITSRVPLSGISAGTRLRLDALSGAESVQLLTHVAGERVADEADAARRIAEICHHWPLALRIMGGRMLDESHSLDHLRRRLERRQADGNLLPELHLGDLSLEAPLSVSRDRLHERARDMFDLLGLHPAAEWADWSAAALCGRPLVETQALLGHLVHAQLLTAVPTRGTQPDRYRFHDLIREYARAEAMRRHDEPARREALTRLASAYLTLADAADEAIHPSGPRHGGRTQAQRYALAQEVIEPARAEHYQWFRSERRAIGAVVARCAELGEWELCWELADASSVAWENMRLWDTAKACVDLSLEAAAALGASRVWAAVLRNAGEIDRELGNRYAALEQLTRSVELFDEVADPLGVVDARLNLGIAQMRWGEPREAEELFKAALEEARTSGDQRGQAWSLEILGECALVLGDRIDGEDYLEQATVLFAAAGERHGRALALTHHALLVLDDAGWPPLPPRPRRSHARVRTDLALAERLLDEAVQLFTQDTESRSLAKARVAQVRLALMHGDERGAARRIALARDEAGEDIDDAAAGRLLQCEAILVREKSPQAAREASLKAFGLLQPAGDRTAMAFLALHLAQLAEGRRDVGAVRSHYEDALRLFGELHRTRLAEHCAARLGRPWARGGSGRPR